MGDCQRPGGKTAPGHVAVKLVPKPQTRFLDDLVSRWIPAAPDLHRALIGTRLRVADVGCGSGWSTIAVARAFPQADVAGFDLDEASVADARRNAVDQGVPVRFEVRDAAALAEDGPFDLILVLEALHDMSRPVEVRRSLRRVLTAGGSVLIADEKVGDHFHAPADDLLNLPRPTGRRSAKVSDALIDDRGDRL